ncbi:hypothetical protein CON64_09145 [Bacillus pseudomycoides]|nr:hypothetical protein CON64_09145 [Bacillus pseudomycoides]
MNTYFGIWHIVRRCGVLRSKNILQFHNVSFHYDEKPIIESLNAVVQEGEFISMIGAAIGEWLGAQAGLGYFSKRMMTQMDGAGVFAPIVLLSLLAIFFVLLVSIFERKFISWRKHS